MSRLISAPAFWGTRADDHRINAPELLTKSTATMLARRIEGYWRKQGKRVVCRTEMMMDAGSERGASWCVRSDMVNGAPR
jgi:hypothetical protein